MKYYPVYLDLKDRSVLLVGAGEVAGQKLPMLLKCRARVHVVSPEALPPIPKLARDGKIRWSRRPFKTGDLKDAKLVIAATDDPALQKKIAKEARARGIWVNIVDVPPLCDFIAPAVVSRGDIQIAISTGGAAPAMAKYLRQKLDAAIGPEHVEFVKMVKTWRPAILKLSKESRRALWNRLVSDSFLKDIRTGGIASAERRLKEWIHAR